MCVRLLIRLSVHPPKFLSSIPPLTHSFVHPSIVYLSIYPPIHPPTRLSNHPSNHRLSIHLAVPERPR